ncbi:MAG: uridine kinase family protein [Nocardioides sp.]
MLDPAAAVLGLAHSRPPTLGRGRLVCIDGPGGSGKTTLASDLLRLDPIATVIHADDLLEGWEGLPGLAETLESLLRELAADRTGRWRRWDWISDGWAEWNEVTPGGLLVLEGVGTGSPAYADLVTVLVWVEAGPGVRLERGLARDGEELRASWLRWREAEDLLHATDLTAERADVRVDGESGLSWIAR